MPPRSGWSTSFGTDTSVPTSFSNPTCNRRSKLRLRPDELAAITQITAGIDVDQQQEARLRQLQDSVVKISGDAARGRELYVKHCGVCHQLRGEGQVVGPQLDGAASRSVARLLEDVLTPNRNVDRAFRTTSFLLDDGRLLVGLIVREDADTITAVDSSGKAFEIDPDHVDSRKEAGRSLMPANMADVLSDRDFADLIRFIRGT